MLNGEDVIDRAFTKAFISVFSAPTNLSNSEYKGIFKNVLYKYIFQIPRFKELLKSYKVSEIFHSFYFNPIEQILLLKVYSTSDLSFYWDKNKYNALVNKSNIEYLKTILSQIEKSFDELYSNSILIDKLKLKSITRKLEKHV